MAELAVSDLLPFELWLWLFCMELLAEDFADAS